MSGEHDDIAAATPATLTVNAQAPTSADGGPATDAAPRTLGQRLASWRATFAGWLAGAPLAPGEIPGIEAFERDASEVMSRQHTVRAQ